MGLTLVEVPFNGVEEVEADLNARNASDDLGIDAMLTIPEPLTGTERLSKVIYDFAEAHRLPIGGNEDSLTNRSLFCVIVNNKATGEQAASLADKILKGAPAGEMPVLSSEDYIQINYNAAQKLGLNVSEGLLSRAAEIIR